MKHVQKIMPHLSCRDSLVKQNEQLKDAKIQDVDSSLLDIYLDFNLDESVEYQVCATGC